MFPNHSKFPLVVPYHFVGPRSWWVFDDDSCFPSRSSVSDLGSLLTSTTFSDRCPISATVRGRVVHHSVPLLYSSGKAKRTGTEGDRFGLTLNLRLRIYVKSYRSEEPVSRLTLYISHRPLCSSFVGRGYSRSTKEELWHNT